MAEALGRDHDGGVAGWWLGRLRAVGADAHVAVGRPQLHAVQRPNVAPLDRGHPHYLDLRPRIRLLHALLLYAALRARLHQAGDKKESDRPATAAFLLALDPPRHFVYICVCECTPRAAWAYV